MSSLSTSTRSRSGRHLVALFLFSPPSPSPPPSSQASAAAANAGVCLTGSPPHLSPPLPVSFTPSLTPSLALPSSLSYRCAPHQRSVPSSIPLQAVKCNINDVRVVVNSVQVVVSRLNSLVSIFKASLKIHLKFSLLQARLPPSSPGMCSADVDSMLTSSDRCCLAANLPPFHSSSDFLRPLPFSPSPLPTEE
ncbi:hypothetical protein C8F01DRAFT_1348319 [Mycena amicta]|nr:hypothetical protein C8F01DRAFT_1348319 [Mycena amicta]